MTDGRTLRSEQTRASLLACVRNLMLTRDEFQPTARTIAEQCRVSVRTIHQHFATMTDLYIEAASDPATAEAIVSRLPLTDTIELARCFVSCRLPGRSAA